MHRQQGRVSYRKVFANANAGSAAKGHKRVLVDGSEFLQALRQPAFWAKLQRPLPILRMQTESGTNVTMSVEDGGVPENKMKCH
jgi:hypothetical protein